MKNKALVHLAKQVVKQSHLDNEAVNYLYTEIIMDLETKHNDLILQGHSSVTATKQIVSEFGNPEIFGKDLALIYKPWLRIPILGELLYFKEFRWGMLLFSLHIIVALLIWVITPIVFSLLQSFFGEGAQQFFTISFALVSLILALSEGWIIAYQFPKLSEFLEIYFISYIPLFFLLISASIFSVTNFTSDIYIFARINYLLGGLLGPMIGIGIYLVSNLFTGLISYSAFRVYLLSKRNGAN